jgi:hypothetical protein
MAIYRADVSESTLEVAERACDLVLATDSRFITLAHARTIPAASEIIESFRLAETALRILLHAG